MEELKNKKIKVDPWKLAVQKMPELLKYLFGFAIFVVSIYHTQQFCELIKFYFFTVGIGCFALIKTVMEFLSKIAYAIITSSIFYYITQQYPKKKKKVKFVDYLSNVFQFMQFPFYDFEAELLGIVEFKTEIDYTNHCREISFDNPVRAGLVGCITWEKLTSQTMEETNKRIDDVSQFSELLDTELFMSLQKIKSYCTLVLNFIKSRHQAKFDSSSLSYVSKFLWEIRKELAVSGTAAGKYFVTYSGVNTFESSYLM